MRVLFASIASLVLTGTGLAQIDTYAAMPRIWDAAVSPDGNRLATGCSPAGERAICIYDLTGATGALVIPPPDGGHMSGFYWPSSTHLIYRVSSVQNIATSSGRRNIDFSQPIAYSLETGRSALLMAQTDIISSLTDRDDRVAVEITYQLDDRPNTGSRLGNRGDFGTVVYEMDLDTGDRARRLERSGTSTSGYVLTPEGETIVEVRRDAESGRYALYDVRQSDRLVYEARFPADAPYIYGFAGSQSGLAIWIPGTGLRRLDLDTGELSEFQIGEISVSRTVPIIDEYAAELVGFSYTNHLGGQIFIDEELAGLKAELEQILTEESVRIISWSADRNKLVVVGRDPGMPANYYFLDLTTGGLGLLDTEMAVPEGMVIPRREPLSYEASDGEVIPAYVTLPPGASLEDGPFPLIVMPHGGPQARDTARFDWWAAHYAQLGYVVLHPNFRGSSGYGAAFIEAGYGGFGTRMIDDMIDGASFLQQEGLARDGEYCVAGASYGGYAAFMMGLRDSERVACVISFAGVTDPFSMLADPSQLETETRYWEQYMGSRFSDTDYRVEITPVDRASELTMPVLAIHGENDVTVPEGQLRLLRNAIGSRHDVEMVLLPDEDHYLRTVESRTRLLQESTDFLQEHFPVD